MLLTTQYLEDADRLAHRIAVVDGGRVIANDTPAALKAQLGSTVIELGMGNDARAARADELLVQRLDAHPERAGPTVRLTSDDGSRLLIDVLRLLDDQNLAPATLAVRDPSMDDVFLALTGRRAEAETAANGAGRGRCAAGDRRTHHLLRAAVGGLVRGHPAGVRPRRRAALPPGRVELAPACAPARERSHPTEVPHERLHRRGA